MISEAVTLPFIEEDVSTLGSACVRYDALARELVLMELRSSADAVSSWEAENLKCISDQERNAALYDRFLTEMHQRCPLRDAPSFSPLSGVARANLSSRRTGLLDPVTVAAPPLSIRCGVNEESNVLPTRTAQSEGRDSIADEERVLLHSSAHLSQASSFGDPLSWTPQQAASQSALDGVFFEALVSQQLSLALWMGNANPDETLRVLMRDVQAVDRRTCEEKALLDFINAARFTEQRAYKRRRLQLESQAVKSKAKVASLEKLLKVGAEVGSSPREALSDRLRLWLHE